jgi:hypothetical protein
MGIVGRLDQYASMLATEFDETTASSPSITGFGTYYASEFSENVGIATKLSANVFPPYDLVYDDFGGTLFGAGQGRYMRQNTDKSVIVYNEIDEITDFYGRGIVEDGLVLNLDAGVSSSYPGSGTTWTDLSGSGNTGTLTNGPTYSSANGGALVFDGTNDFIDFTSDFNLLPTAGLTVSVWFKTTVADRWLVNKTSNISTNGYVLISNGAGLMQFGVAGAPGASVSTPSAITTGAWINIVGTWTPSTSLLMYQNGTQVTSNTTSIPASITNPSVNIEIGRNVAGTDNWNGSLSQLLIYSRALTAQEISQNYNALKNRFGL